MSTVVAGVDPGLVNTGLVVLEFSPTIRTLITSHDVIDGLDPNATRAVLTDRVSPRTLATVDTYIEWYRPRSNYATDERMVAANQQFKDALRGTLVKNTGVKKIVSKDLMQLLGVWKFPTASHHQDLKSAARIAILGMLLDPPSNRLLYDFAVDNYEGRDWDVQSI
jgi:hypothetical protein